MKVIVLLLKNALEGHDYGKTYDRKKKTESVEETLCSFNGFLCDIVISVYMCAVLVVLPLYNKGYAQIGTEKENFSERP